jgi:DNA-binding transcriptional LysR family regulator
MTLTELRYIVAVARHRHFGKAAEACFVSQPTLSVAVRKLEDELGVRLFERSHNDVLVTDIGRAIVAQAETVLGAADTVKVIAEAARDPLGRELRLGVIYTVGPYLVPRLIPGLKQHAPHMALVVQENFTDALAAALKRGELDAVIMSLPYADPQLLSRPLYDEPFNVALPARPPAGEEETHRTGGSRVRHPAAARCAQLLSRPGHRDLPGGAEHGRVAEDPGGQFAGNHLPDGGDGRRPHHPAVDHAHQRGSRRAPGGAAVRRAAADAHHRGVLSPRLRTPASHPVPRDGGARGQAQGRRLLRLRLI